MTKTSEEIREEQERNAASLKENHETHAVTLAESQKKDALNLKKHYEKNGNHYLKAVKAGRTYAVGDLEQTTDPLSNSRQQAASALEKVHVKAAESLKQTQETAAAFLEETHLKAAETHQEKDDVISWLQGDYSVKKDGA